MNTYNKEKRKATNVAKLIGKVKGELEYTYSAHGLQFYKMIVDVQRLSGNSDLIPVMITEKLVDVNKNYDGQTVFVKGHFRSFKMMNDKYVKYGFSVIAKEVSFINENIKLEPVNSIYLSGIFHMAPTYRVTPNKYVISDCLLEVKRPQSQTDFIPCIFWGESARAIQEFPKGSKCELEGRIQSRTYIKATPEGDVEKTVYEVSVMNIISIEKN